MERVESDDKYGELAPSTVQSPRCPPPDRIKEGDSELLWLFARLLRAQSDGMSHPEIARTLFSLDSRLPTGVVNRVVQTHLFCAHGLLELNFEPLTWYLAADDAWCTDN